MRVLPERSGVPRVHAADSTLSDTRPGGQVKHGCRRSSWCLLHFRVARKGARSGQDERRKDLIGLQDVFPEPLSLLEESLLPPYERSPLGPLPPVPPGLRSTKWMTPTRC